MTGEKDMLAAQDADTRHATAEDSLRSLFHRLNNQLGIVLANAELLESRVQDEATKARAAQVVDSALQAMATVREIRTRLEASGEVGPVG
jgi:two-component sensor histidine kinase